MNKNLNMLLCFDFGVKKIGICFGETIAGSSTPLPVIKNNDELMKNIKSYVDEWDPDAFLIGCPSKPSEDFFKQLTIFKESLRNKFKLEVIECNEDFTSQIISSEFKNKEYDSLSAQKIFESWINVQYE
jgi:putative Holliday junction resolvase